MAENLEHLELPITGQVKPRRKSGSGRHPEREDKKEHSLSLVQQSEQLAENLQKRITSAPKEINPRLIFKLQLHESGYLDENQLSGMGLTILSNSPGKAIVVFPDEATLANLQSHLKQHAGLIEGHKYAHLTSIEQILEIQPNDRLGHKLKNTPIEENQTLPLDIELWHLGNHQACLSAINEIRNYLVTQNLAVTDTYIGQSLCLMRARLNSETLNFLLNLDYVKEIDRRPEPTFEMLDISRLGRSNIEVIHPMPEDLVGILIIDSGVMQQHPLIGSALGDAQAFPESLADGDDAQDVDNRTGGHGTAVAGIAIYNDVGECIQQRSFQATASLFSARVTNEDNEYDPDVLLEKQLHNAVDYFLENYPSLKVINISLGDSKLVYDDNYQFRFAAAIDEIAYLYRDRQLVFVISAGNCLHDEDASEIFSKYPDYLLQPEYRVIDPATSAIAITVGGISYGTGRPYNPENEEKDIDRPVANMRGAPSPFTRTGWGVDGAIKPDVVDYAGDLLFKRGVIRWDPHTGVPTTSKNFSPPDGRLFRTVIGTSFAAPRVANLAARLFHEFPNASSNLIRALIATSAKVPQDKPRELHELNSWDDNILRIYGYGQPSFDRARWSNENDVVLMAEDSLEIDSFNRYQVPSLPMNFVQSSGKNGNGYLSVTLAFDPPTRHTRYNNYLGITMNFYLYRNIETTELDKAFRIWSQEEKGFLGENTPSTRTSIKRNEVSLKPGVSRRGKGTLQKGLAKISGATWKYDGTPLSLVVVCQSTPWTPKEILAQPYAIIVSVSHENPEVQLYNHIRQQTRVYQRTRIRL